MYGARKGQIPSIPVKQTLTQWAVDPRPTPLWDSGFQARSRTLKPAQFIWKVQIKQPKEQS